MKNKKFSSTLILVLLVNIIFAQQLMSPDEFLGYELGSQFSRHHQVVDYYDYLAENEKERVKIVEYGTTNEGRKLRVVILSSAENMANLKSIQENHLKGLQSEETGNTAVVWLSYNVHGNESVSTEASMKTAHHLLTQKNEFLENTVVLIDPCINPDGRDRYVNLYKQRQHKLLQADGNSAEHYEGWQSGRTNHYIFDLNRDWAWMTQKESQQRLVAYQQWMPHIHVDFHEQGVNSPYYFAPAVEPYHEIITDFQRSFQDKLGRNHAKYFDKNGWLFFTDERFDLLYPSYGDTYPTYNGAIGMTYEQGGSGRAGLGIYNAEGELLTLKDRIAHHFTTGISTVEVAAQNSEQLITQFNAYYKDNETANTSYIIHGNSARLEALQTLLEKHGIETQRGSNQKVKGFDYLSSSEKMVNVNTEAMVVSTKQTKGKLARVLLEPKAYLSDSLTYDITAWSLPYAYGLNAIETEQRITTSAAPNTKTSKPALQKSYAYIIKWDSFESAKATAALMQQGVKLRNANRYFGFDNTDYAPGTMVVLQRDNTEIDDLNSLMNSIQSNYHVEISSTNTGYSDRGKDFGSSYFQQKKQPQIAVLRGDGVSSYSFGEWWYFFEQDLNMPFTAIDTDYLSRISLESYDILIIPSGRISSLSDRQTEQIKTWTQAGGKLILQGSSLALAKKLGLSLEKKKMEYDIDKRLPNDMREREMMKYQVTGAIFKAEVDQTHPLGYGLDANYFSLKLNADNYELLSANNAIAIGENHRAVSGFAGEKVQENTANTLLFGSENLGRGQVIYLVDNPLFRGFWYHGKLIAANALFQN